MSGADFHDVVRRRRSVRRFSGRPLPEESLERIREVGRLSASADNRQPWRFLLLHREGREEFDGLLREHFRAAPVILVALARPDRAWVRRFDGRNYARVDVAIAVTEMVLAATAEGIGSCWIASFDPHRACEILGVGPAWEPVAAVALGYPAGESAAGEKQRRPREEVWEIRGRPPESGRREEGRYDQENH